MKKLSSILLLFVALLSISAKPKEVAIKVSNFAITCKHGQCSAIAKSTKKQCKNCAQKNSTTCYTHR